VSRKVGCRLPVNADTTNGSLASFKDPSKPAYWTTPVPLNVFYAYGDPERIETLLPYLKHTDNSAKSLVILQDPDDHKRPLFVITSLRTRFFPRGTWKAYLYQDKRSNGLVDRLQGSLTLSLSPSALAQWVSEVWREAGAEEKAETLPPEGSESLAFTYWRYSYRLGLLS